MKKTITVCDFCSTEIIDAYSVTVVVSEEGPNLDKIYKSYDVCNDCLYSNFCTFLNNMEVGERRKWLNENTIKDKN